MDTIWKHKLKVTDRQTISLPRGATVLSVHMQNGYICLWARVDPDAAKLDVPVGIVGTDSPCWPSAEDYTFVVTVIDAPFVWHVFIQW